MSAQTPVPHQLNLVCPNCGYQFRKSDRRSIDTSDYRSFLRNFSCNRCSNSIHPEDALLEYFDNTPTLRITGRPTRLGGFSSMGNKSVLVGETERIGVIGAGTLDFGLMLLSDTSLNRGQRLQQLSSDPRFYPGPIKVNNSTVVDLRPASSTEIEFITSERNPDSWDVTFGYHFHAYYDDIPQPPWVKILESAIENFHMNQGLAMYSLLFSAFESFLSREIARTLSAMGWTNKPIDDFFDHGKYWNWEDRCKDAINLITSEHIPTKHPNLYRELKELKKVRNNEVTHVDPGGQVANIDISELRNSFELVMEMMINVHKICYDKRQQSKYPIMNPVSIPR